MRVQSCWRTDLVYASAEENDNRTGSVGNRKRMKHTQRVEKFGLYGLCFSSCENVASVVETKHYPRMSKRIATSNTAHTICEFTHTQSCNQTCVIRNICKPHNKYSLPTRAFTKTAIREVSLKLCVNRVELNKTISSTLRS